MKDAGIAGLIERFADLPDSRVEGRTDHDLLDIVVLALCAVMSGAEGWDDIEDWGREREAWLRRYLRLRNGIPGHDTIRRVFEAISPLALEERIEEWMSGTCPAVKGRVIAIDGKALRGSARSGRGLRALHQVSAYAAEYGLTLGQRSCAEKSNEITAIEELLPSLALEGAIVTIDAMGCQTGIAEQITQAGGDYVLAVKDNQPLLADSIRDFFTQFQAVPECTPHSVAETVEKDHGRIEVRRCWAFDQTDCLARPEQWADLQSFSVIESERCIQGKTTLERRFYLSSLPADAARLLTAIRAHWAIENRLHWCMDVAFADDQMRARTKHAAHNLAILKHITLNLIRLDPIKRKGGIKARRFIAATSDSYREHLLGLV